MLPSPSFRTYIHFKSGFTVVELLVVVATISVLVALLLPALSSARNVARDVKCTSNLAQIGKASALYASESDGYLAPRRIARAGYPASWAGPSPYASLGLGWNNAISPDAPLLGKYTGNTVIRTPTPTGEALFIDGNVSENSVWRCPSDTREIDDTAPTRPASYAASPMKGDIPFSSQFARLSDPGRPDIELAFVDARGRTFEPGYGSGFGATVLPFPGVTDTEPLPNMFTIGSPGSIYNWSKRHRKQTSANVLFFDGHVAMLDNLFKQQLEGNVRVSLFGWRSQIVSIE
jgi:prepilin-type processing-associated H-X9-DG protein